MKVMSSLHSSSLLKQIKNTIEVKLAATASKKDSFTNVNQVSFQYTIEKPSALDEDISNAKVQSLMEKFKSGQKLTLEEMNYIRSKSPENAEYINRIMKERELYELTFKNSPTKFNYYQAAMSFANKIERSSSVEDVEVLSNHLRNAMQEYEKTDEFKEKPNFPLDLRELHLTNKKIKTQRHELKNNYINQLMLNGYESNKKFNHPILELLDKKY